MEKNPFSPDQVSANVQGNPVNGINLSNKVFAGHSSPAQVAHVAGAKHIASSSNGGKEVCGSALVPSRSYIATSESLRTSTPSASQTGVAASFGGTPVGDGQDRKAIFMRNATPVDHRSKEIRSCMKSSSVISTCSPASITNGNRGSSLSPGSLSNGNRSVGLSTSDSIFTYSLTDESHDEIDDCKGDRENEATKTTMDSTGDAKTTDLEDKLRNIPAPCDNNNFVDKIAQVKNVIHKEYIHRITYTFDDLTSLEKNCGVTNSELCGCQDDEQLQRSVKKSSKSVSSADQKEPGHKKFSSRSVRSFLKSMSPGSRHREQSKSSESVSSRSTNTLAGSLDSASASEDLEETGAELGTKPKTLASSKKSPGIGKKSPSVSHSAHEQKPKRTSFDPVADSLKAGESNVSGDCQVGGK